MRIIVRSMGDIPKSTKGKSLDEQLKSVKQAFAVFPHSKLVNFVSGRVGVVNDETTQDSAKLDQALRELAAKDPGVWNNRVDDVDNLWEKLNEDRSKMINAAWRHNFFEAFDTVVFGLMSLGITSIGACSAFSDDVANSTAAKIVGIVLAGAGGLWTTISNFVVRNQDLKTVTEGMSDSAMHYYVEFFKEEATDEETGSGAKVASTDSNSNADVGGSPSNSAASVAH